MTHGSTIFLRLVLLVMGISALAVCVIALPLAIVAETKGDFDYAPILIGLYAPAVPFLWALYEAWRLLGYIDKNTAFSTPSIRALRNIKFAALAICGFFAVGMPYIFYVADQDDAPGLAFMGFVIIGAAFVIATFAAVLQKLIQNAVDIKSENDLTV